MIIFNKTSLLGILSLSAIILSCNKNDDVATPVDPTPVLLELKSYSTTPSLVTAMPGFESLKFFPLIGSEDVLVESPSFIFGAQPDGAGLIKNPNAPGFIMINNHEILNSVSRVFLDANLKPYKGEYIVDRVGGVTRLCSATMATVEEHGFGPVFLTAGESGQESLVHAISPFALVSDRQRSDRVLPALGKASMENAVPLPKDAYPGKTIILVGEDQSYASSHASAGQLLMYMNNVVGDLQTGVLHTLRRTGGASQVETDMVKGTEYDVEFAALPDIKNKTGAEINTLVNALGSIRFCRVEDVDYRKGSGANGREIYFTATGQANGGTTAEPGYTMWGRIYKLVMSATDPTKGKLELVAEGDSNPGNDLINPDNICVTENFVYFQEDGDSYYTAASHDSYIWQYNIATKIYKPWLNMNHKRTDAAWNTKYNVLNELRKGSWEYGAMYDVSKEIGVPNTFLLNIHPHTWTSNAFANADGSGLNTNREGGQVVIISGVQK
jgi:hypothetical protein